MLNETIDLPEFINIMIYLPKTGYDKLSMTVNKPMPEVVMYDPTKQKYIKGNDT